MKHGVRPGDRLEGTAVHHIQAVKDVAVDGDQHGEKGKDHSLKLISWHKFSSLRHKKMRHEKTDRAKRSPIPKHFPCSVISIALRSARVIMCCIQLFSIVPEKSKRCKGHFKQKEGSVSPCTLSSIAAQLGASFRFSKLSSFRP
jgi:hypothetical protein